MADDTESVDLMVSVQQLSLNNNLSSRIQGHSQISLFLRQDDYFLGALHPICGAVLHIL